MTDYDSNAPEWVSDPTVAGWLGTPDTSPPSPGEGSDMAATEQDSPPDQWPDTDDSVWASDPAVAQWLDTPPPPDSGEDTAPAPDASPPPVAGTGYDADATIQMAPITDSTIPPTRSAVPPSPLAPAPAVTGKAADPDASRQGRRLRRPQRRTAIMAAAVVAAAVLVLGLVITTFSVIGNTSRDGHVAQPPPPAVVSDPTSAAADEDCPNRTDGPVTTGRDAGGTTSGPAAIKAFEYAYFVDRSGAKAREVVAPLARVPSAQEIQGGIDTQLAPGTGHCLRITDRTGGLWGVELTMLPPAGAEPEVLRQLISTAVVAGRTLITAITKDTTQ